MSEQSAQRAVHRTALAVNGLTRNFGGLVAVDAMTFDLAENEVLGLIGPNGSGKTTLLKLMTGFLDAKADTIEMNGKALSKISIRERAKIFTVINQLQRFTFPFSCTLASFAAISACLGSLSLTLPLECIATSMLLCEP